MKRTVEDFWQWFADNKELLMDIDSLEESEAEAVLLNFDEILKSYSEGLDFEIGDLTTNGRTLLLTTNGNEDFFDDVFNLYDNAPILDFWEILPLRQAQGPIAKIHYGKYRYNSKNLFFVPLESEQEEDKIGIKVGLTDYHADDEEQLIAVYSLIEAMIGEYDCATMIGYFELCLLPDQVQETDFIPLLDLPEFISWKTKK